MQPVSSLINSVNLEYLSNAEQHHIENMSGVQSKMLIAENTLRQCPLLSQKERDVNLHIPSAATQELDILSFERALCGDCLAQYDREKWIYIPDFYSEYRYILGTRGERPLICIGINPSTAEPDNLDNTLKSVSRIAQGNGFDSWVMFNVYAQRATRPNDMDTVLNMQLHRENMMAFEYVLRNVAAGKRPAVWAAWGAIIEKRRYLPGCVRDMVSLGRKYNAVWLKCGECSAKGHPHHPLYLRKDLPVEPFDVEEYLDFCSY